MMINPNFCLLTLMIELHPTSQHYSGEMYSCPFTKQLAPCFVFYLQMLTIYMYLFLTFGENQSPLLFDDQIRRDTGLFLIWHRKLLCMHVHKDVKKSVCDINIRNGPASLLTWPWNKWCITFCTFWHLWEGCSLLNENFTREVQFKG